MKQDPTVGRRLLQAEKPSPAGGGASVGEALMIRASQDFYAKGGCKGRSTWSTFKRKGGVGV